MNREIIQRAAQIVANYDKASHCPEAAMMNCGMLAIDLLRELATAAASPAQPAQQGEREAFEAWHKSSDQGWAVDWHGGDIFDRERTVIAWEAWQAARSAPRPVLTDEQIKSLAEEKGVVATNDCGNKYVPINLYVYQMVDFARLIERAVREGGGK